LPEEITKTSAFLIIDNASTDRTSEVATELCKTKPLLGKTALLRTKRNLGYAGSQKLAFRLCREAKALQAIIMLHADGQYPPSLLPNFYRALRSEADVAYGYRAKNQFGVREETPLRIRLMIRLLNSMEGIATNCREIKEWHSGFVGYRTEFLNKINLKAITDTRHIDGNMLFAAASLSAKIQPIPIYKRYRHYEGFGGPAAYGYILDCCKLMLSMPKTVKELQATTITDRADWGTFDVLSTT
jgi:glycosyltransferase involved in cell wall biosynthesis